jgi:hypothetical protein
MGAAEPRPEKPEKVRVIRTVDGEEVRLDAMPTPVIQNDSLHATVDGERYTIATDDIVDYKVERVDVGRSIGLALLPLVIVVTVYMIKVGEAVSDWDWGDGSGGGR